MPEESDLFQPSTGVTKGTQVIARELLLCLQNVDEGLVIELHHLAAELNVDVKKIFLVTNVLEAVGMVSRISIKSLRNSRSYARGDVGVTRNSMEGQPTMAYV